MTQGSFEVRFALNAPLSLWDSFSKFGHIVVTPQWVDHRLFDDPIMLGLARYSGVILNKELTEDGFGVSGAGMVWWLGDEEGKGDIIETKVALTSSTLDNAMTNLLPAAISKGTITEPAASYTGEHQWETPLDAVRTVVASMGCEYRVNPDGSLDAGPNNSVYNIDTPVIVVTRSKRSGGDSLLRGVDVDTMSTSEDSRSYASRAIVITEDSDNVLTLVGGQDRSPIPTEYDMNGNLIDRVLQLETSGSPVDVTLYLTTQMNEHVTVANMEISTEFYEIQNGDLRIGDAFWAFDPPAFVDTANEVWFRGEPINPKKLRLIAASWPLRPGMGVYYRPPLAAPSAADDWVDVTSYIQWEDGSRGRLGVRV
jgi:hypothetical protein